MTTMFTRSALDFWSAGTVPPDVHSVIIDPIKGRQVITYAEHRAAKRERQAEILACRQRMVERWAMAVDSLGWHNSEDEFFWEWCASFTSALWSHDRRLVPGTGGDDWSHPENVFPLRNLWTGISASFQEDLDRGLDEGDELCPLADLILCPSRLRWLSLEPLLGPLDLRVLPCRACNHPGNVLEWPCPYCKGRRFEWPDWVVIGGESGPHARPCNIEWIRSIRDQCRAAGVPVFIKQLGAHPVITENDWFAPGARVQLSHRSGGDPDEWPDDLRVREFPGVERQ